MPQTRIRSSGVRRIFELFAVEHFRLGQIETWLNGQKIKRPEGQRWTTSAVRQILTNEIYVGTYVFGKRFNNLGRPFYSTEDKWIRSQVMEPIVPQELFDTTQARLARIQRKYWTDQQILEGLSRLLREEGRLSYDLVGACPYLPETVTIIKRFGKMSDAFRMVGYEMPNRLKKNAKGVPYSDEELLSELRRIHDAHGYLTVKLINADGIAPDGQYYARRFGGIIAAMCLAGIEATPLSQRQGAARRRRESGEKMVFRKMYRRNPDGSRVTHEQLVGWLKGLLSTHGYLSAELINKAEGMPSASIFAKRLGNLREAYKLAGYHSTRSEIIRAARLRLGMDTLPSVEQASER